MTPHDDHPIGDPFDDVRYALENLRDDLGDLAVAVRRLARALLAVVLRR